ncbi:alpha/beta fold hydrolase [Pseudonocardia sp. KRD291]|uniref:alpha/beta fold hydrolase n=1 Tax=Pseudonocardia sp. KRD291 TaxID=2792007 RepID=UPI001C49E536|nr:alpha/beta hydrolase [Pseudonocardia sp. KRD291]MBW0107061.1 alpha/beta hydrolase [Pseudonocardia sp. KRD291]
MEREVEVEPGVHLWVQDLPATPWPTDTGPAGEPVLLVMGADDAGPTWPDALVDRLRTRHRVIRYDHRDTGRSTHAFEEHPYGLVDLAADAVTVLDACGVARAHAVGMAMGGSLVQLLLLDHPQRLAGAALLCTTALEGTTAPEGTDDPPLPGPSLDVLRMWQEMTDPRDERGELAWRVEYRRRLNGGGVPFDGLEFRALEQRLIAHAGRSDAVAVHAQADPDGLDRGGELSSVTVPTLVVEAPEDPVYPPPHAAHLAERIGPAARLVRVPGMGHALPSSVVVPLAEVLLAHAASAEGALRG